MTATTLHAPVLAHAPLNGNQIRALFPGLTRSRQNPPTALFDNAGGSPLPACVIDAATEYLTHSYANTGGAYPESLNAAATIKRAHDVVGAFVNAGQSGRGAGSIILGSSTTALVHLVANAYADALHAGSLRDSKRTEIIVSTAGHEANIGPWARIAERLSASASGRGVTLTLWPTERVEGPNGNVTYRPRLSTLKKLISDRTLLVAMPQVSNILGEVWDDAEGVRGVCALAKQHGARTFIDGVAAAPHAAPDVQAIGCDWYVYSPYKVFGPHSGALFGTHTALAELVGPNHFFIPNDEVPRKWEVGGVSHEACAMIGALPTFVRQVLNMAAGTSDHADTPNLTHTHYAAAFDHMAAIERTHQARIIDCLNRKPSVRIVGPATAGAERVATIAFTHATLKSSAIAAKANALGLGIRSGHFYSKRLIDELAASHGIDPTEGIVRASALCTNSTEDIDRLVAFFDATL
jgi:selenocysteine lyase/cysteine desulfurase